MAMDHQLKTKSYYKTFLEGNDEKQALLVLGEKYVAERQKEVFDLSKIRFVQGEIYYLNKDYEAAIFKWENVSNELLPWAQKNIADAHLQLDFLAIAEEYYKDIQTDSKVLQMEILLQLFLLYVQRGRLLEAKNTIQKAVNIDPDYPDVTKRARAFYEKEESWREAFHLAEKEAVRTKSLHWFRVLKTYVQKGFVQDKEPNYFYPTLTELYMIDKKCYEQLVIALWDHYKDTKQYFSWLLEISKQSLSFEPSAEYEWKDLRKLYKKTFAEIMSSNYSVKEISNVVPSLILNWFRIAKSEDEKLAASALVVWDELYPFHIDRVEVENAKDLLLHYSTDSTQILHETVNLFELMAGWADEKGIILDSHLGEKMKQQLDLQHYYVLIGGNKSSLLDKWKLNKTSKSLLPMETNKNNNGLIQCKISMFKNNEINIMESPGLLEQSLADLVIYIVEKDTDIDEAIQMQGQMPEINFLFLINNEFKDADFTKKIKKQYPNAGIMNLHENTSNLWTEIISAIKLQDFSVEEERATKTLSFLKRFLCFLLDKRKELENNYLDTIERNEEIVERLYEAIRQLNDLQNEKIGVLKNNYRFIKHEIRENMLKTIPKILRECADIVSKDSDFEQIHVNLNDEMNQRVNDYVNEDIFQVFHFAMDEWIKESERELKDSKDSLDEISTNFNQMCGKEKMVFDCDLRVLDDWARDVERMCHGNVQLEEANILMRSGSSQFLMKGAGRIFGSIPQKNKNLVFKKYRQFIETKDYSEITKSITDRFMLQLDLFEKSIQRDIEMFFKNAFHSLEAVIKELEKELSKEKQLLYEMSNQPEIYKDPITLFEFKVRQLQILHGVIEPVHGY
ncbi:M48 family metallopeptidase [Oceanobacillus sp. Castelsardo]|uniref:tetratricopeptide repeat protein n=1 Tax=Oceanobacillus sp. Castelsardo TaxID=1851204 RepID=UPI000838F50D|nr:hypothetical protein [Oceanobacillus sp. Castelsardo]